jgi:peptidoglycan-associated lipoprotein
MTHARRLIVFTLVVAAAFAACRKKPQTVVTPVSNTPPPRETCDQRCRDSIATREKFVRDSMEAANNAARDAATRRAIEAAKAALTAKIFFDYDMSDITPESRATLDAKLPVLRANPTVRLRITGHADERGSDEYNLALGSRRAAAAKRYLTDQGIDPSRIDIFSYGEERPAVSGMDEAAYRQNRRDEFEITAGVNDVKAVQ